MIYPPPLRVKKLYSDAQLPVRANPTDSGVDVFVYRFLQVYKISEDQQPITVDLSSNDCKEYLLRKNDRISITTGLSVAVDPGFEIQIRPRDSSALKKGLSIVDSPGTVNSNFRGPVLIIIVNLGHESQMIKVGDKIAQLVVSPVCLSEVVEVENLDVVSKGFGSFTGL